MAYNVLAVASDLAQFERDLAIETVLKVEKPLKDGFRLTTEKIYELLFTDLWPIQTGWSMANHHIGIGQTADLPLEPATRPDFPGPGVSLSTILANKSAELRKLDTLKPIKGSVVIGNTVPYAADVGFSRGRGIGVYNAAANQGSGIAATLLDQGAGFETIGGKQLEFGFDTK